LLKTPIAPNFGNARAVQKFDTVHNEKLNGAQNVNHNEEAQKPFLSPNFRVSSDFEIQIFSAALYKKPLKFFFSSKITKILHEERNNTLQHLLAMYNSWYQLIPINRLIR
jgi:hypothetical protein